MKTKIIFYIRFFIKLNWLKTCIINFRLLSFHDALHFPILIFGPCYLHHLSGKVIFNQSIKFGMLIIGISDPIRSYSQKTYISLLGKVYVGNHVVLRRGLRLFVSGNLTLENSIYIGDNNTIICSDKVLIKEATRTANNITIMDTDFHYVLNTETREVKNNHAPIVIGENNWIGGHCVIKKGTKLPKGTIIIGPFSSVSKDLIGKIPENSMLGGSPVKLIRSGYRRVNSKDSDAIIKRYFKDHKTAYILPQNIDFDDFCMPKKTNNIQDELL